MTRLAIIFSLLFVTPAWAETVLYCQTKLGTGITKDSGSWQTVDLPPNRFTVKFDEKKMTLSGSGFTAPMKCKQPAVVPLPEIIYCANEDGDNLFHLNTISLRFSKYSVASKYGWITDYYDMNKTYMVNGTCEKF